MITTHGSQACDERDNKEGPEERRDYTRTSSVVETEFAEIGDGTLLELIEHPEDSTKTLLAIYKEGEVRYTDRFQCGDRVLVPIRRDQHLFKRMRLPRGAKVCGSAISLVKSICSLFSQCVDLDVQYLNLLAVFVLSTWFIDQLPVAPYVALVGLPRSGKSTVLSVLRLLCRRALLTADVISAGFYRALDGLTLTLLIDETSKMRENRLLLRTGTTRDVVEFRKGQFFTTFGAKVLSWTELPNDTALNSRCLLIPMQETHRTDLKRPWDPEIVQAADELQQQFLQLRFEKYKKLRVPKIEGQEKLYSRFQDFYEALVLPISEHTQACEWLLRSLNKQQEVNREPLTVGQSALLRCLFGAIHCDPKNVVYIHDLTKAVNSVLEAENEHVPLNPREVGSVLSSLGFTDRKRSNHGWTLRIGQTTRMQIHKLIATYGYDNNEYLPAEQGMGQCDLCKTENEPESIQQFELQGRLPSN